MAVTAPRPVARRLQTLKQPNQASDSVSQEMAAQAAWGDLHGYDYPVHHCSANGVKLAYIDEGPSQAAPIVLLHSVPAWGYAFRHMLPWLLQSGHRVLVPDLLGCGRSDKPSHTSGFGLTAQLTSLSEWLKQLDLQHITLYGQGLGGLLGFRWALLHPQRFDRLVLANTRSPLGPQQPSRFAALGALWPRWSPVYPVEWVMRSACQTPLSRSTLKAYAAPFSQGRQTVAVRQLANWAHWDVRKERDTDITQAWLAMTMWHKPLLTLYGSRDHLTHGGQRWFIDQVPGAKRQPHQIIHQAGHCLSEDKGPEVALALHQFISRPQA